MRVETIKAETNPKAISGHAISRQFQRQKEANIGNYPRVLTTLQIRK